MCWLLALWIIWGVVAAGVAVYVDQNFPERFWRSDSGTYLRPALELLHAGTFPRVGAFRSPGYPGFLALITFLFGEATLNVILVQVLLGMALVGFSYLSARVLLHPSAAFLGASLLLMNVNVFLYTQFLMSEIYASFFYAIAMYAGVRALSAKASASGSPGGGIRSPYGWYGLLGVALALGTLGRPVFYYLLWVLPCGIALWEYTQRASMRRIACAVLIYALAPALLIGGWQLRNGFWSGNFAYNFISSYNLLTYTTATTLALRDGTSRQESLQQLHQKYAQRLNSVPRTHYYAEFKAIAIEELLQNKSFFLLRMRKSLHRMLEDRGIGPVWFFFAYEQGSDRPWKRLADILKRPWMLWIVPWLPLNMLIIYVFSIWGFVSLAKGGRRRFALACLLAGFALYLLFTGSVGEARARFLVSAMPMLSILTGIGLHQAWIRISRRTRWGRKL